MRKGQKHTAEARAKMSSAHMGKKHTPQSKIKMSAATKGPNNPRWGKSVSPEVRAKISASRKGKKTGFENPMWGKHLSPETRAKLSAAHKGKRHTAESRTKMSAARKGCKNAMYGKKHTPETLSKMSAAHRRENLSPETLKKMSASKTGPKHPRWLGGISHEPYGWEFNAELKEEVRRRDGYKCQLCGVPQAECARKLSVHHIDYCKTNSSPVNLITLCVHCHTETNSNRQHWTVVFQEMAAKRDIATLTRRIA